MENRSLILKFNNKDEEFLFENKVSIIRNRRLIENLERPSIKNLDSNLLIKSLDNTHISDVLQLKVNLSDTGYFLVNFAKDSLKDEEREVLIKDISGLKNESSVSNELQLEKAKHLIKVLNKYSPLYVSYINNGFFSIDVNELSKTKTTFPLLVLEKQKLVIFNKFSKRKINEVKKENPNYFPIQFFSVDYLFVFIFTFLCSFGVYTAIFEIKNSQNIAIFLIILAVAFAFILSLAVQSTVYRKCKIKNPLLKYYLIIFIVLGVVGGITLGYFISKLVLKTEIADFNYKNVTLLTAVISTPVCLSSLLSSTLVNFVIKYRLSNKNK